MAENQEGLVISRSEKIDNKVVRLELANQIRQHAKPNHKLADRLENVASSPRIEVFFSFGYGENIDVEMP